MSIAGYLRVFRERWLAVVICVFIGVNAAVAVTMLTTPKYTASALLFLKVDSDSGSLYDRSQFSVQRVKSYPDLVDSPDVLTPVIRELRLHTTPQQLASAVSATNPIDTVSLKVTAEATTAVLAADLANSVAKHLSNEVGQLESAKQAGSSVQLALTVPATAPAAPQSPDAKLNLLLGVTGGTAAGLVLAILLSLTSRAVRTAEDVRRATGLPLLAQLPGGPRERRSASGGDGARGDSEAYVDAMVALRRLTNARQLGLLVLVPADGVSSVDTLRLDLARATADTGRTVCVLEADARASGSLPFPPQEQSVGLGDVLAGAVRLDAAIVRPATEGFAILPAGELDPPRAHQGSARPVTAVIDDLHSGYEVLIAQAGARSRPLDVAALAPRADAVVVVARYGRTRSDDLARIVGQLEAMDVQPLGVMMTGTPRWVRAELPLGQWADAAPDAKGRGLRTVATLARTGRG
ncbi:Wzz/FepE/Etk N-terminal domain-containing protein [Leifsonia sp. NPDC080035]|uniref:Wzz/FepE/Etk N-terminal domain-containing protein n=1 Tax=Leifsonia sp. NPDC080035 TaxID=3143936 RepID=A0AAU7G7H4_9MICO